MSVQRANLDDLVRTYYRPGRAATAADYFLGLLQRGRSKHVAHLLRTPSSSAPLTAEERKIRGAFDDLLAFYSVLEIAMCASFIDAPSELQIWKDAAELLDQGVIHDYCEQRSFILPQALLLRLSGRPSFTEKGEPWRAMLQFLALDQRFRSSLNHSVLLRILLEPLEDKAGFARLEQALRRPGEFFRRLSTAPHERTTMDRTVHKFLELLNFCVDLERFLSTASVSARFRLILQSHYSYLFVATILSVRVTSAIRQLEIWNIGKFDEVRADLKSYINQGSSAINSLQERSHKAWVVLDDMEIEEVPAEVVGEFEDNEDNIDMDAVLGGGIRKASAVVYEDEETLSTVQIEA